MVMVLLGGALAVEISIRWSASTGPPQRLTMPLFGVSRWPGVRLVPYLRRLPAVGMNCSIRRLNPSDG